MISTTYKWWIRGLFWAAFMYLIVNVLMPLFEHEVLTTKKLLIGIPVWLILGLLMAWISGYIYKKLKHKVE